MATHRIGIIGGSGLYHIEGFARQKWVTVKTPFGPPSDQLLTGELAGREVVFLPRPYLAGLGLRQQLVAQSTAADDPRPILFVDLGAGSTEACLIGENFPRPTNMAGLPFGGDHVESLIEKTLLQEYPGYHPTRAMLRAWKEEFGFVGEPQSKVVVKALMDGVERQVVLTQSLRCACEAWLEYVHELEKFQHARAANSPRQSPRRSPPVAVENSRARSRRPRLPPPRNAPRRRSEN